MKQKIKREYKKYQEIIRYLIVGVLTTIISLGSYYLLTLTFLNPKNAFQLQIANIISWILSVSFAYITNRIFVFKSNNNHIFREVVSFFAARVLTLIMDMVIMFLLVTILHINDRIAKLIVQVIITISNYIFSKLFVFKK